MTYKERLAEIRRSHALQAHRDAFMRSLSELTIPVHLVKLDTVPLHAIFQKMDRRSTEPYKVISCLRPDDWRQELMQAAASLIAGRSSMLFCWREMLSFESDSLVALNLEQLERWFDAYKPGLRGSDLLCCDQDRSQFIGILIDEHEVLFKRLGRDDFDLWSTTES